MYCRECGNQILDSASWCPNCGTKTGEGVGYCQNCGSITSMRTEFCFHCGAKQRNIMTQKLLDAEKDRLLAQAKKKKWIYKISMVLTIFFFASAFISFCAIGLRDEPTTITYEMSGKAWDYSAASYTYTDPFYQKEGQGLFFMSISFFVYGLGALVICLVERRSYKKILKKYKQTVKEK